MASAALKLSGKHLNDELRRDDFQVSGFGTEQSPDCQTRDVELMLTEVETSGRGSPGHASSLPQGDSALVMAASNLSILSILLF